MREMVKLSKESRVDIHQVDLYGSTRASTFYYSKSELPTFREKLDLLLSSEQSVDFERYGYLLALRTPIDTSSIPYSACMELKEMLIESGFKDGGNRGGIRELHPHIGWAKRQGNDVVLLPGYFDHGERAGEILPANVRWFFRRTYKVDLEE